jgi:hypothetical protein
MSKSNIGPARSAQPIKNTTTKNVTTKNVTTENQATKNATTTRSVGGRSPGTSRAGRRPTGGDRSSGSATTPARARASAAAHPKAAGFRSRHPLIAALVPVGLVVEVIATMVVLKATGGSTPPASYLSAGTTASSAGPGTSPLSPSVLAALTVPATTLDAVGSPGSVLPPSRVGGGGGAVLRGTDGKPVISYVGAEFCPYCAAERWALAVALSRFGTFSHLSGTHSASGDVFPNTQTLSFYGSSYSSPYVDFQPVEEATNQRAGNSYQALQTPTAAQSSLLSTYDASGSIPFLDIGNRFVINGASYSPQVLQGLSRAQIAAELSDPTSQVGQAIDGAANNITAAISTLTGHQPGNVCNSPTITAIAKKLGA